MTATERKIVERVDALRERLLAWLRELVAIPTVNPYSGDASAGSEAAGQAWMAARLRELGAEVRQVPVPPDVYARGGLPGPAGRCWAGRENVVGEWRLGPGPSVIVNSHMDTVGTDGMTIAPFDPVLRDGRLYGRGTSDSKGNLVMGLIAIQALRDAGSGQRGRILFESVVDEECNGGGAGTLACCLAGLTADFALVVDGQRGRVAVGCNGVLTVRFGVQGRAGHSACGGAVNAIDKALAVKQAADAFFAAYQALHPACRGSVNVFRAGTLPAIVPVQADLTAQMTYDVADAREAERNGQEWGGGLLRGRLEAAVAALAAVDPWFREKPVQCEWIKDLPPYAVPEDHPLARTALAAAGEVAGEPVTAETMPAWFDAARIARALRIPVIGLGHGAPGAAHASDEFVRLEDLACGAKTLALTLHRLLGAG